LKSELQHRSEETGRSLTQEAEFCIEAGLALEQVFGGQRMAVLLRLMAAAATLVEAQIGRGSMMTDYWTYTAVEHAWKGIIDSHRPFASSEIVELLDEVVRLGKALQTLAAPEYPAFPIPQHLLGLGYFESEEQRHEHEARVREWEQQMAEWRSKYDENKQKMDTALNRFKNFEEIGKNAAKLYERPDPDLQTLLAGAANPADGPTPGDKLFLPKPVKRD
jgi:hypothetical protein